MAEYQYIRQEDLAQYRDFCLHHLKMFARPTPPVIWHYTNAEGLIGILSKGEMWATQVSCLNDSLEFRYFGDLVYASLKEVMKKNSDPNIAVMLRIADDAFSKADYSAEGRFAICFSEVEDDLGQWRGYGGGECGYAIGFDPQSLLTAESAHKGSSLFVPMHYEDKTQAFVVDDLVRMAQEWLKQGVERGITDIEKWAAELVYALSQEMAIFSALIKHPKFAPEKERRITVTLTEGDRERLVFRQKRTLLARHLPIDLKTGDSRKLPIKRVYVGPGPSQRVSQVSVADLLVKHGYADIQVEISKVPYRMP